MQPWYWGGFWGLCALITFVLWLADVHLPNGANPEPLGFIFLTLAGWAPWIGSWRTA